MILTDKQKTRLKLLYQKYIPEIKTIEIEDDGFVSIVLSDIPICFTEINKINTEYQCMLKKEKERKYLYNLKRNKFKRR
jgi:hypothetical protein